MRVRRTHLVNLAEKCDGFAVWNKIPQTRKGSVSDVKNTQDVPRRPGGQQALVSIAGTTVVGLQVGGGHTLNISGQNERR